MSGPSLKSIPSTIHGLKGVQLRLIQGSAYIIGRSEISPVSIPRSIGTQPTSLILLLTSQRWQLSNSGGWWVVACPCRLGASSEQVRWLSNEGGASIELSAQRPSSLAISVSLVASDARNRSVSARLVSRSRCNNCPEPVESLNNSWMQSRSASAFVVADSASANSLLRRSI